MHTIHILTNAQNEAYIMVLNKRTALDTFLNEMDSDSTGTYEKRNPVRVRFMRDNRSNGLEIEYHEVPIDLGTDINVIRDYRDQIIAQYGTDGYLVVDEKYYSELDKPADKNFGFVLKAIDIPAAVKKFGQETLLKARKTMTTGEFIEAFGG